MVVNVIDAWRFHGDSWPRRSYAGGIVADDATLVRDRDFRSTQKWKRLRRTRHDHNPVHDALGNAEALIRILDGER